MRQRQTKGDKRPLSKRSLPRFRVHLCSPANKAFSLKGNVEDLRRDEAAENSCGVEHWVWQALLVGGEAVEYASDNEVSDEMCSRRAGTCPTCEKSKGVCSYQHS